MRVQIETDEMLILRDGRPFGESGTFGGYSVNWPFPQTIAGMVRTAYGQGESNDFFTGSDKDANIAQVMDIGIEQIVNMGRQGRGDWSPLFPLPADILITEAERAAKDNPLLTINSMVFTAIDHSSQGTDIKSHDWLYAKVNTKQKPARQKPFLYHWSFYKDYLSQSFTQSKDMCFDELGIHAPITDSRVHNALNSETLTTGDGKLFCNNGFYLKSAEQDDSANILDLSIHFSLSGVNEFKPDNAYLGGERKVVALSQSKHNFPEFPDCFDNKQWLKVILTTHGDFGGWCPQWLEPNLMVETIDWVTIPDTDYEVRLRSACVAGWDAVSGWDYETNKPKAMRKLVKPGAVYLIEIKNSEQSRQIAQLLWGGNLTGNTDSQNIQSIKNGHGQCVVANALVNP